MKINFGVIFRTNPILSIIVMVLNIVTIYAVFRDYWPSKLDIMIIGTVVIILALIYTTFREIYSLTQIKTKSVVVGESIKGTKYDYLHLFDDKCEEIWMVGQNLATALTDDDIIAHIISRINDNKKRKAYFIMTTYDVLKALGNESVNDLLIVLGNIKGIYEKLDESNYNKLSFGFDKSATSLSGVFRNPDDDKRGMLAITTKWWGDRNIGSRFFFVIKRSEDKDLFDHAFSGHLKSLNKSGSQKLCDICNDIRKSKEEHNLDGRKLELLDWFINKNYEPINERK